MGRSREDVTVGYLSVGNVGVDEGGTVRREGSFIGTLPIRTDTASTLCLRSRYAAVIAKVVLEGCSWNTGVE